MPHVMAMEHEMGGVRVGAEGLHLGVGEEHRAKLRDVGGGSWGKEQGTTAGAIVWVVTVNVDEGREDELLEGRLEVKRGLVL